MLNIPYCGVPPPPGRLVWNYDPVVIVALTAVAIAYAAAALRSNPPSRREKACFAGGWLVLALALLSPLCNLSVALFSARVSQHMLLALVAAPLIVLGRPDRALASVMPRLRSARAKEPGFTLAFLASAAFALAMWIWHAPGPYAATFRSDAAYWMMHLTVFGSAFLVWHVLLDLRRIGPAAFAGVLTAAQMGLLGALLTLAPRPLFEAHALTTLPWGLSPLADQQLGGLIMWIPGGLLLTVYALGSFGLWLKALDEHASAGS